MAQNVLSQDDRLSVCLSDRMLSTFHRYTPLQALVYDYKWKLCMKLHDIRLRKHRAGYQLIAALLVLLFTYLSSL